MLKRQIIRSEAKRAATPAVLAIARDSERRQPKSDRTDLRKLVGIAWRCYRHVCQIRRISPGDVVLPQDGHKYREVHEELTAAAQHCVDYAEVVTAWESRARRFDPIAFVIVLRSFPALWRSHKSSRLRPFGSVLCYAKAFSMVLQRRSPQHWVIIGDLSPHLIALAGACAAAGHRLVYWQYSYLDFKHMPARSDVAIILNDSGRYLATPSGAKEELSVYYWRPRPAIEKTRLNALDAGTVGSMLNVHADVRALRQLQAFSAALNRRIEVRLHPNSRLNLAEWPDELMLASKDETLEEFARRHALLLCGNTQAQAKALADGTPVVHCKGLDPLPFDHHGYVRDGILPGCADPSELDQPGIREFYSAGSWMRALELHMGPEPDRRVPGLDAFLRDLAKLRKA